MKSYNKLLQQWAMKNKGSNKKWDNMTPQQQITALENARRDMPATLSRRQINELLGVSLGQGYKHGPGNRGGNKQTNKNKNNNNKGNNP